MRFLFYVLVLLVGVGCSQGESSAPTPASPIGAAPITARTAGNANAQVGSTSGNSGLGSIEVVGFVLLAALALVLVLLFMHKRRTQLLESPHLVTPQNFRAWTGDVERRLASGHADIAGMHQVASNTHERLLVQFNELQKTFLTLQRALDTRDQQLRRAEGGWELQVFKRFLTRFARIDATLNEGGAPAAEVLLADIRAMLEDALAECGVEKFFPRLGADFRSENGVSDQPLVSRTPDTTLHYRIKRVISPAYVAEVADGQRFVVLPGHVEIYAPLENAS